MPKSKKKNEFDKDSMALIESLKTESNMFDRGSNSVKTTKNIEALSDEDEFRQVPISMCSSAPEDWNYFSEYDEETTYNLVESILSLGLLNPIIVRATSDGDYTILAGHNRVRIFKQLFESTGDKKYKKIVARVKSSNLDDYTARQIVIDSNYVGRTLKPSDKARSIAKKYELMKSYNHGTKEIIGKIEEDLNIKSRMQNKYKALDKLIKPFLERVDEFEITVDSGAKIAAFDVKTQKWLHDTFGELLTNETIKKISFKMSKEEISEGIKSTLKSNDDDKPKISVSYVIEKEQEDDFKDKFNKFLIENGFKTYKKGQWGFYELIDLDNQEDT